MDDERNAHLINGLPSGDPIGTIGEVRGPVVDIKCRRLPALREALLAIADGESFVFEVHQHLDAAHVRAISLHDTDGLKRGLPVYETDGPLRVPVAPECLGRLLDVFGAPLDGGARG